MASTTYLQQAYLAYFGRPADVSGLSFYASRTEAQVVAAFSASPESQAFFGSLNTLAQINAIYQNLFNRAAEPAGLVYWAAEINTGRLSLAQASMGILAGAQNDDKLAVTNKLAAATAFTAALDTSAEMIGYQGSAVITSARTYLASVGSTAASLTAATATAALSASVATVVAAGTSTASTGSTFTLTTDADELTGTAGDDTFRAPVDTGDVVTTFSSDDVIDGGDGTDTLTVYLNTDDNDIIAAPLVTDVEILEIRASDSATLDLSGATLTGLEEIAIVRARETLALTVDDLSDVSLRIESASTSLITITVNDANDSTLTLAITSSDVDLTIAEQDDIDTLDLSITDDSSLSLALATDDAVTTVDITGEGDFELVFAGTALTSIDASGLEGGLTFDGNAVAEDLTIVGGTGDDAVTGGSGDNVFTGNSGDDTFVASTTGDIDFSGGADDDTLDLSALSSATGDFDDSSFVGGLGTDTIIINADALTTDALADAGAFTGFEVLEIGANSLAGFDFSDFSSITELVIGTGAAGATGDIDNADNKTITVLDAAATLTITDDTSSDIVVVNIDSGSTSITAADITTQDIEDITVNITAGGTSNAITVASLAITGSDTAVINIADASTSGAVITITGMTIDSGDVILNLDADDAIITAADMDGADSVTINFGADDVLITALTTDAADVVLDLAGDTNVITAATLSGVTTLVITTSGDSNEITTLTADSLVDLTLDIDGGDFAVSLVSTEEVLETITITGDGEVTSLIVADSEEFTTLDLSGFSGTIAVSGIDLTALTVGVDIEIGELTGATAADTLGQILLDAANTLKDTIVFNDDFDGFLMIDGFEGGADVTDDMIDLSALGVSYADLDIADDGTDTEITSDEFDFTIVLTGVTAASLSQLNFTF